MQKPFTPAVDNCLILKSYFRTICLTALAVAFSVMQAQTQCPPDITVDGPGTDTWQAPSTGGPWSVEITAIGGGGGDIDNFQGSGGGGATMIGTFIVQNNQFLRAIAGGGGGTELLVAGGGGGGSGAVNCGNPINCANGTILILAAGGNGEGFADGTPGSSLTNGNGAGGIAGSSDDNGGGGGGVNSGGADPGPVGGPLPAGAGEGGGQVQKAGVAAGGAGGPAGSLNNGGNGMGGGGGGGSEGPGGGGGHTGGAGGDDGAAAKSFNTGTNQNNSDGADNAGPVPGQVVIHCIGSLPVELINFKAVIHSDGVKLLWSTATEKENLGYDIERSPDGRNWTTLGFVPGNGNTTRQMDYNFADGSPMSGVNYYRLKQMDNDGDFEYSPMVIADVRSGGLQFDIYPNPSTDGALTVRAVSQKEGEALLELYDWVGYKVYKETVYLYEGTVVYPVSLATYPKGTYTARIEMPDGTVLFKKVLLQ